jgi:hypothetical protein
MPKIPPKLAQSEEFERIQVPFVKQQLVTHEGIGHSHENGNGKALNCPAHSKA